MDFPISIASQSNRSGRFRDVLANVSSAGHGEAEVRRKIVETGDVDVMIAIRSNFFYTRTVPCELWHFDKGKPEERRDRVMMLDARNIYRKVTRKILRFQPRTTRQPDRHRLALPASRRVSWRWCGIISPPFVKKPLPFPMSWHASRRPSRRCKISFGTHGAGEGAGPSPGAETAADRWIMELVEVRQAYEADRAALFGELADFATAMPPRCPKLMMPSTPLVMPSSRWPARSRGLVKQVDLLYKPAVRCGTLAQELASIKEAAEFRSSPASKRLKQLDEERKHAVEQPGRRLPPANRLAAGALQR